MKLNRLTKAGILIIVIGLSFLAGTFYRSTKDGGGFSNGTLGGLGGLGTNDWSITGNIGKTESSKYSSYFLAPRDYRMTIKTNSTFDVYMLDSSGLRLWLSEGKLEPAVSYEGINAQAVTFHLNNRDEYTLLVHNPAETAVAYEISVSGYGIESDLLNVSTIILVIGAIITAVSFVPKNKGATNRKQSAPAKKIAVPAAILTLIVLTMPFFVCCAQASSFLAPEWMKEGTYVSYDLTPMGTEYKDGVLQTSKSLTVFFPNGSYVKCRNVTSVLLRWDCIELKDDIATLNVTYSVTSDYANDNFYTQALVDVDVVGRSVYVQNGTLIGTTNLWLPSNPAEGQEVVLWDVPPDKVTANVTTLSFDGGNIYYGGDMAQGAQRCFQLNSIEGTINGRDATQAGFQAFGFYEYDTGLMLYGSFFMEPVRVALGVSLNELPNSVTTNVDMGPAKLFIDWGYLLGLAAVIACIVLVAVLLVKKRHRKR